MGVRHQAKEAESAKKGKAVQRLEESKEMKLSVRPSETRLKRRGKGLELSSGLYMFVSIVRRPCVAMAALVCAKLNENELREGRHITSIPEITSASRTTRARTHRQKQKQPGRSL